MTQQKKYFLVTIFFISCLLIGGFFLLKWALNFFEPLQNTGRLISVVTQMKDLDEEELAAYNPKTQKAFDVLHYDVRIELYPQQKKISGEVIIKLKVNDNKLDKIDINFYDNMKIKYVELSGKNAHFTRSKKIFSVKKENNLDTVEIKISYEGTPQSLGFGSMNFEEVNSKNQIYTISEPVFASTWLPCVDVVDDKALLDMYITNDSNYVSLSNGKLIDVKRNTTRKTYHWKTFYPISTYLIAIYSGTYKLYSEPYTSINGDKFNIEYYATENNFENAKKDFSDHSKYIKTFEELFGPYPFPKEKYSVAEFWWQNGAMENQTITGIGSRYISGMKFFSDMLVHELAHHWWGNAVSPRTWKDIWLNEGFATYSVALYWEKQSGFSALQSTMFDKNGNFNTHAIYNPGSALFDGTIYNKGAWVLHMLRKEIGDQDFFKSLKKYFEYFKYSNASTEDFKNICEKISGKKLQQFFNQWVYKGKGRLEIQADWESVKSHTEFTTKIKIKQLQKGYEIYKFPLEIKLVFDKPEKYLISTNYISTKDSVINISTKEKPTKVILDPDYWLLAEIKSNKEI